MLLCEFQSTTDTVTKRDTHDDCSQSLGFVSLALSAAAVLTSLHPQPAGFRSFWLLNLTLSELRFRMSLEELPNNFICCYSRVLVEIGIVRNRVGIVHAGTYTRRRCPHQFEVAYFRAGSASGCPLLH